MKIGDLATRTGTSVPTIRYYEGIGLIPTAHRQGGGQRVYSHDDVSRLLFIRRCRDFGFSVEQVRSLAALGQDSSRSCGELRDVAASHLEVVTSRIAELQLLAADLQRFVERCDASCAGGPGPACTILGDLASTHSAPSGRGVNG